MSTASCGGRSLRRAGAAARHAAAAAAAAGPTAAGEAAAGAEAVALEAEIGGRRDYSYKGRVSAIKAAYLGSKSTLSKTEQATLEDYVSNHDKNFFSRLRTDGFVADASKFKTGFRGVLDAGGFGKAGKAELSIAYLKQVTRDLMETESKRKQAQRARVKEREGGRREEIIEL